MGLIGGLLGQAGGAAVGNYLGGSKGGQAGQQIGGILGGFLPFKKGGMVENKTQKALLHQGEMVVPKHLVKKVPKSVKDAMRKGGARNM
jgi:hypothetical protein